MGRFFLKGFANSLSHEVDTFLHFYQEHFDEFSKILSDKNSSRGEIEICEGEDFEAKLSVSLVMNDVTSVTFKVGRDMIMAFPAIEKLKAWCGNKDIIIDLNNATDEKLILAAKKGEVSPLFMMPSGEFVTRQLDFLSPLVEKGRLLPRPERALTYIDSVLPEGNRLFNMIRAQPDAPADIWNITEASTKAVDKIIRIDDNSINTHQTTEFFDILVPFIYGIPPEVVLDIIEQESDVVSQFRANVRQALRLSVGNSKDIGEYINDDVRPQLDKMERKFRFAANMGRLKVGGAVLGTTVLELTAAYSEGYAAAASIIAGASGLAYTIKEVGNAAEAHASLKDNDLYLLWKLRRTQANFK